MALFKIFIFKLYLAMPGLSCDTQDLLLFSDQGSNSGSLGWDCGPTEPTGKSQNHSVLPEECQGQRLFIEYYTIKRAQLWASKQG